MKRAIWICFLLLGSNLFSQDNFCENRSEHNSIQELFKNQNNLFSFRNDAGIFDSGVCWWHSRLQRNTIYLAKFRPNQKKINKSQVRKIIRKLIKGKKVQYIDGYKNFYEFSKEYKNYILKRLTLWQIKDGVLKFAWINGLRGRTKINSEKLKEKMTKLHEYINDKNIAYTKLQLKGIASHSWLIIDSKKESDGINFQTLDSNNPKRLKWYKYKYGDKSFFNYRSYGEFVPYLEQKKENKRVKKGLKKYCKKYSYSVAF